MTDELRKHYGYVLPGRKLKYSEQRVGQFKVLKQVGDLAYYLELPPNIKVHPVVSVAYLAPHKHDEWGRVPPPPRPAE